MIVRVEVIIVRSQFFCYSGLVNSNEDFFIVFLKSGFYKGNVSVKYIYDDNYLVFYECKEI